MDLLEQYKQQYPEKFRPKEREPELGQGEYGFIIRFVIHLPGGMVRNAKEASYILLGAAGVSILLTLIIFFWGSGRSTAAFTPKGYVDPLPSTSLNNP